MLPWRTNSELPALSRMLVNRYADLGNYLQYPPASPLASPLLLFHLSIFLPLHSATNTDDVNNCLYHLHQLVEV